MIPDGLTLYVVRHGQTEFNAAGRIAGHQDSRLTALGRAQAAANGRILRGLGHDLASLDFVSSPLHRAAATMELLLETAGLDIGVYRTDHRLMERSYGDWNGRNVDELDEDDKHFRERHANWWRYRPPRGETAEEVYQRTAEFAATLTRDAVIVSHSGPSIMLRGLALGLNSDAIQKLRQTNHGIVRLSGGTEAFFGD